MPARRAVWTMSKRSDWCGPTSETAMRAVGTLIDCSSACRAVIHPRNSAVVVPRDPDLVLPRPPRDRDRLVEVERGGGDGLRNVPPREGRQVDERLEKGAGLPLRLDDAVELRDLVVASPHEGPDRPRRRVERDEGALQLLVLVPRPEVTVGLLHLLEAAADRRLGGRLHLGVERRVDREAVLAHLRGLRADLLHQEVDEVRRDDPGRRSLDARERSVERFLVRRLVDLPQLQHPLEDDGPPLLRPVGMPERRVAARARR